MNSRAIIYTYKNKNAAKRFIGKVIICCDNLYGITEEPHECTRAILEDVTKTKNGDDYPFKTNCGDYQFIREI